MTLHRPSLYLIVTAAVLALAVALRIADPDPVARLRLSIFDSYLNLKPRETDPAFPVRIVDIDEASLAKIGQWPWPRSELAHIIDKLAEAGAKTVAIDLILAEPDRLSPEALARQAQVRSELAPIVAELSSLPSNDAILAHAMGKLPVVVGSVGDASTQRSPPPPKASFAIAGDDPTSFVPSFPGVITPLPVLTDAAAGNGAVNWLPAKDQIVRQVPLLVSLHGTLYPTLSLEALRTGLGEKTAFVRSSGGSGVLAFGQQTGVDTVRVGKTVLPTSHDGQLWLNFAEPDPRRYVSAHKILDGSFDPKDFAGRHVLIGASATGLLDLRATPLASSVPGVEIHAQAIEQMLSGEHLTRPALATGAEILFLVAMGALVAALIRRSGPLNAAIIGCVAIAAIAIGSWLAFARGGYLFDPVYPSLSLLAVYLSGSLLSFIKTETDRARVKRAFGHYLAAPLVEELATDPSRLKLGGETRDVTLLFADVRGFSRLSEGMDAETLIRFVNRLFTPLSDIILEHRGTIDKFMGDAVMAFWNAPVRDPEHARNACRAALTMQIEMDRLNREEAARKAAAGETHVPIRIGIGLNTGACCVGNVGSPQRFDYSVLGDAVNVASRIEGTTKTFGAPIIAGETTAHDAADFAFLEIDTAVRLRGKDRPERLHALVGDEAVATSPAFRNLSQHYAALRAAMEANQMMAVSAEIAACREAAQALAIANPGAMPLDALFEHYARRAVGS
ncbi:adenylate/guanylate cyclase domain-containing protein [Hyphomicrobium sp.]|uniref:CHASE2 domain-containing protein n=1 Tax=Hyphomicrobium sp. TaxID=82 RepID=UPI002E366256|nr:adenylate/guanylate cyclase domain-containing protein [Hyphomicrobium sp.]HEX2842487.1 adenylate/guanylate cyclase domain-containing protein [Hyphomicrobium sp.]